VTGEFLPVADGRETEAEPHRRPRVAGPGVYAAEAVLDKPGFWWSPHSANHGLTGPARLRFEPTTSRSRSTPRQRDSGESSWFSCHGRLFLRRNPRSCGTPARA
jgi:hypothetical protein